MKKSLLLLLFAMLAAQAAFANPLKVRQNAWRWRNDNGNETTATWIQNTNTAATLTARNQNIRLRIRLDSDYEAFPQNTGFGCALYYNNGSGDVLVGSANSHFVLSDAPQVTNGSGTTNQIDGNTAGGQFFDTANSLSFTATAGNQYQEYEFCIKATATAINFSTYSFFLSGLTSVNTSAVLTTDFCVGGNPTAFALTGSGTVPCGSSGASIPIGLAGSQTGFNYQLLKNGVNQGPPVAGTGSSISFGNQTIGTYTAKTVGTVNPDCFGDMTGYAAVGYDCPTQTFNLTGTVEYFVVPAGINLLHVVANGAKGGAADPNMTGLGGGLGGKVEADVSVTPGQIFFLQVGGAGISTGDYYNNTNSGGYNGGAGGVFGGGATDIRLGGTALANRILVAGGGGAGGLDNISPNNTVGVGGAGGGLIGGAGAEGNGGQGGGGGTQTQGGASAACSVGTCPSSAPGQLGLGGTGVQIGGIPGKGGGGGYYGGGGGASAAPYGGFGGGGGGSSYTDPMLCSDVIHTQGGNTGTNGSLVITFCNGTPPTVFNVTGAGSYSCSCPGRPIGISGSQIGVTYQLLSSGVNVGSPVAGTGSAISFGVYPLGTYTVTATGATPDCISAMTGSAVVTIDCPTFNYTGGLQTLVVPPGVTSVHVVANGAKGSGYNGGLGGNGGKVETDLAVSSGQTLNIYVGAAGSGGGYNGGAGGGGGASDIRIGGTALADRVLVAGGGGAGFGYGLPETSFHGGAGGGLIGGNGTDYPTAGLLGGGGGTQTQGGAGGGYTNLGSNGENGSLGNGGSYFSGGGGGYYGGGGGSTQNGFAGSVFVAGGGGSSYTSPALCSNVVHTQGGNTGDYGSMVISWSAPCNISGITASTFSACNNNGTGTTTDDYFTTNVTVNFSYPPASGNLTLKRGSTTLASIATSSLACAYSYTFTGVQISADGASVILTAEFSDCTSTFTSANLGTAPICALACPILNAAAPVAVVSSQSTCTLCNLSGGVIAAPTTSCPAGSTLQYSTDNGASWSATLPTYNQTTAITVLTRCNCDVDNNISSPTSTITTAPDTCTPITAGLTNNGPLTCTLTSVTLTGTGSGTYAYSGGSATVNAPGTYTVTVTGTNGCTATATAEVMQDIATPTASLSNDGPLTCTMTSVSLLIPPVPFGNTYTYSSGPSGITAAGTYTVTVTSTNGCTATATTEITQDIATPTASLSNDGPLTCTTTSVTLTGTGSGTYAYSGGSASVTAPGTYTVTVTSANGCTATATTEITQDIATPTASLSNDGPLTCTMTSVSLLIPPVPFGNTYTYSSGPSGITAAGTYTVTVSGTNGCTATATTEITQDIATPTAGLTNNGPLTCTLTSVTLTGTGSGTYAYSGGSATVNAPGTYTVTVTGTNGCTATATAEVMQDIATPTASLSNDGPLTCTMTSVSLLIPPVPFGNTYTYSSGPSGITAAGTYTVTVTSTNGCTATATTEITQDIATPIASLSNDGPLTCALTSVTLTGTGVGTYTYSSGPSNITAPGTYTVTVSGTNGCTATATTDVTQDIATPTASLSNDGPLTCTMTSVSLLIPPVPFGNTYTYSSGPSGITAPGTYTVTVTSTNGCTATATTEITQDIATPIASLSNDGPLTCALTSVTLTATGVGTYTYSSGPSNITAPGTYTVTVTGTNGCTATATTTTTIASLATASNNGPVCEGGAATLSVNPNLPVGVTATYAWSGPAGTASTQNPNIPNMTPSKIGTYTVTVTYSTGCTATATTVLATNPKPVVSSVVGNCVSGSGRITINATGTGLTYNMGTGAQTNNVFNGVANGTYTVTITNAIGCTATANVTVNCSVCPTVVASSNSPVCASGNILLSVNPNLPMGVTATYSWSGPGGTATLQNPTITNATPSKVGVYTVTVTYSNGCISTASTTVTLAPSIAGTILGPSSFCIGGSAVLTATGGLNYVWSTNATSAAITVTTAGTYVVTITNGAACKRVSRTVTTTTCKNTAATMPETLSVTPNPFAERATIEFMTNSNGHTSINVYSIDGRQLATLYNANTQAGEIYQVTLDGANLPNGMYFVEMTNANGKKTLVKAMLSR